MIAIFMLITIAQDTAFAQNIDWDAMSDQEIANEINSRAVIASRMPDSADHLTIANQNGVEVYLTRRYRIEKSYNGKDYIIMEAVVVNGLNDPISITNDGCCINGWAVETEGIFDVPANSKKKDTITMCLTDAEISTLEEITDVDYLLRVFSSSTYDTLFTFDNFTYVR